MIFNRVMVVILCHFTQSGSFGANKVKLTETRPICDRNVAEILVLALYDSWPRTHAFPLIFPKTDHFSLFELCTCAQKCSHLSNSWALFPVDSCLQLLCTSQRNCEHAGVTDNC